MHAGRPAAPASACSARATVELALAARATAVTTLETMMRAARMSSECALPDLPARRSAPQRCANRAQARAIEASSARIRPTRAHQTERETAPGQPLDPSLGHLSCPKHEVPLFARVFWVARVAPFGRRARRAARLRKRSRRTGSGRRSRDGGRRSAGGDDEHRRIGGCGAPAAPAPEPAKLGAPYPIVLMHGMSGFGQLELGPIGITYFDGVVRI